MVNQKLETLIVKYLTKGLNSFEFDTLLNLFRNEENIGVFKNFIKIDHFLNQAMNKVDTDKIKRKVFREIREKEKTILRKKAVKYLKYAAVFIFGLTGAYYTFFQADSNKKANYLETKDTSKIVLELEDGTKKIISSNGHEKIIGEEGTIIGQQKGNALIYNNNPKNQHLVYNKLYIPNGIKFQIVLSDGTIVHLNSGSYLKYPVSFSTSSNRRVYLEGEAYFDVAKNTEQPFVVTVDNLDVTVLGTKFNISNYPEELNINTVLVEGKIKLTVNDTDKKALDNIILLPSQMASKLKNGSEIITANVNTAIYTAWRTGSLNFRATPFNQIIKRLERKFNVTIENKYELLEKQIYTASFYDDESVYDILGYLKHETNFHFNRLENRIVITKPN